MKQLIIGLIGLGNISAMHIDAYRKLPGVRIKALSDKNQGLLLKRGKELSIRNLYPDYHFMLRDPEIDIIDIMTPHNLHAPIACDAMRAGKHVICEKPLATTISDVTQIYRVSKQTKKSVHVKQYLRFSKTYQKAFQILSDRDVGAPYFIQCMFTGDSARDYQNPNTWRGTKNLAGGGVFMNVGQHMVDLLFSQFGPAKTTMAKHTNITNATPGKGEDFSSVLYIFPNNLTSSISTTHNDTGYRFRWEMRIYATNGIITVIDTEGKHKKVLTVIKNREIITQMTESDWWHTCNTSALHDCIQRIRSNKAPLVDKTQATHGIAAVLASYKSSETGKFTRIPQ